MNVSFRNRHHIVGHEVFTVAFMGWAGIKNGQLLNVAADNHFDCIITTDRGIEHEQNNKTLPLAVVFLHAASNDLEDLQPMLPGLLVVLGSLSAQAIAHVRSGLESSP